MKLTTVIKNHLNELEEDRHYCTNINCDEYSKRFPF